MYNIILYMVVIYVVYFFEYMVQCIWDVVVYGMIAFWMVEWSGVSIFGALFVIHDSCGFMNIRQTSFKNKAKNLMDKIVYK